jgi:hypothetical protein
MHVCPVACYRCLVCNTPFHWILLINFMNKSYAGHQGLNNLLNGKNHQPSLIALCGVVNHFKRLNIPTHYCWEVKLNYLHTYIYIYMYTVTIKKNFNKELHVVPFWESMLNVFLSRWMCPTNAPMVAIYCLWLIKLTIVDKSCICIFM